MISITGVVCIIRTDAGVGSDAGSHADKADDIPSVVVNSADEKDKLMHIVLCHQS